MRLKALVILATLTISSSALACSCERNPTAAGILAKASTVFTGVARSNATIGPQATATTFEVTEAFKGATTKTVVVNHPSGSSASCGVQFETGESYTLAAYEGGRGLTTTLCSTWMFMPQVNLRDQLIADIRAQAAPAGPRAESADDAGGWRVEALPDGGRAAIGTGTISGERHTATLACDASKRPTITLSPAADRALLVETSDGTWAFPNGAAADALAAGLIDANDKDFKLAIDGKAFPAGKAAIDAFEQAGKDCEQRAGWQYGTDDEKQLIWTYRRAEATPPVLVFGKPSTGWLLAEVSCQPPRKALVVKSTALPQRAKNGQTMPLAVRIGTEDFSASGRVTLFNEGDVSGFLTARFAEPRKLLDALRMGETMTLTARDAVATIPARGASALLPQFERACGL